MDSAVSPDEDKGQYQHGILPIATAEEESRQDFVKSLKLHLATKVAPGNHLSYEVNAAPRYEKAEGHAPQTYHQVRRAMADDPYFNFWSALQRNSQEMMWKSAQLPVERQLSSLIEDAKKAETKLGSLELDPDLEIPRYHKLVDIHCMPGGYHTEFTGDDVANGAVYDRAVYVYAMGRMGPFNSDIGDSMIDFVHDKFPDLKPKRILDLGCAVGHSTLPYVTLFRTPRFTLSMWVRRCCVMAMLGPSRWGRKCISRSRTPRA